MLCNVACLGPDGSELVLYGLGDELQFDIGSQMFGVSGPPFGVERRRSIQLMYSDVRTPHSERSVMRSRLLFW
jgi:hypothetical protein